MKVTVKDRELNVRVGRPSINAPTNDFKLAGEVFEVEDQLLKGDLVEGVDIWLKDEAGNYYWSGGVIHAITGPIMFNWFDRLNIKKVWDQFHEQGDKVKVAILDTGYNLTNPEIKDSVKGVNIVIDNVQYPDTVFVIGDQSLIFHGTRCASLAGANNRRDWLVGIAPACELIVGKISINREIRDFNYIMKGIKWAIDEGAEIISISYAYEDLTAQQITDINTALNALTAGKNVLIFAAAGNSGDEPSTQDLHPAAFDACVSVGASNAADQISAITVLSGKTTIHAPGEDIESFDQQNNPTTDSGTSYSTPIVAGIAALAVSFLKKRDGSWDKTELLQNIYRTGDPIAGMTEKRIINPVNLFKNL